MEVNVIRTTRYEYKYLINYKDYVILKPLLNEFLIHDREEDGLDYQIASIYFDDIYHTGAMDKAFGNETHKKYRVRYYQDKTKLKLELKEKIGDVSTKYSTWIDPRMLQALIENDLDYLEQHYDNHLIRRFALQTQLNYLKPNYNIAYRREAYRDYSDNLRVTFDKQIKVARYPDDSYDDYIDLIRDSQMVLEVKYQNYLPKEIKAVLKKINLNQVSFSKYFMGYNQLNY